MLTKDRRRLRLTLLLGTAAVFLFLCIKLSGSTVTDSLLGLNLDWPGRAADNTPPHHKPPLQSPFLTSSGSGSDGQLAASSAFIGPHGEIKGFAAPSTTRPAGGLPLHTQLHSLTTSDRAFFRIVLGSETALNPNIIPHPTRNDTWIVVAQRQGTEIIGPAVRSVEIVCSSARFVGGALTCVGSDDDHQQQQPAELPIAPTTGPRENCKDNLAILTINRGPHDARVFYGPRSPFVVYGSNSAETCFGQWIQDLRSLMPDVGFAATSSSKTEEGATAAAEKEDNSFPTTPHGAGIELHRPPPIGPIEKNYFLFWDLSGKQAYIHVDTTPRRAFAALHADGTVGPDLATSASAPALDNNNSHQHKDSTCLARYLPTPTNPDLESVHQATNSLSITLCRRADPACVPGPDNTFVVAVVQYKTFAMFHSSYHPYVVVFRQRAPFEVWAVSKRPLWIAGRGMLPSGDSEMFYVTSMSWRAQGQTYHGYVDDVLFLAFGIEDKGTGGIDVLAGDLLGNLGLC